MWSLFKSILFLLDAERVHHLTMKLFRIFLRVPGSRAIFPPLGGCKEDLQPVELMGLQFPNRVGLAAGFDKDGKYFREMSHLGFGFIEIGTVTPEPQAGNPRPRLFRLPKDRALLNRMGFNNEGVEALVNRLRKKGRPQPLIIGGNIGKNKWTPNEEALEDYLKCFRSLYDHVDYFVVNVSSPNTPGLRELQDKQPLLSLLSALQSENQERGGKRPILLKIAPDVNPLQLKDIAEMVLQSSLSGVIVSNTTIERAGLRTDGQKVEQLGAGGLSGAPIFERSTEVLKEMRSLLGPQAVIIGVGGIDTVDRAKAKLEAGADLVQVYTGLVYRGPGWIRSILRDMIDRKESY